jgi:hypothetical protein
VTSTRRIKKLKLQKLKNKQREQIEKEQKLKTRPQSTKPERTFNINEFPLFSEVPPEFRHPENLLKLIGKETAKKSAKFVPLATNIGQPQQKSLNLLD